MPKVPKVKVESQQSRYEEDINGIPVKIEKKVIMESHVTELLESE